MEKHAELSSPADEVAVGDIENPIMVMARDDDAPVEPRCWQREWLGDELRHGTPPKTVSTDELDGITVAIYFAEPNHGASKDYSQKLIETYNSVKAAGNKFEIVLVSSSSDETASDFEALFSSMPWLAVPFEALETKAKATKKFNITNQVPALVVVDPQGNILTNNLYWPIISPSEFPWKHASTNSNEGPKKSVYVMSSSKKKNSENVFDRNKIDIDPSLESVIELTPFNPCFYIYPILCIVFFLVHGRKWGEVDDSNCAEGFPTWMLVMGLGGLVWPGSIWLTLRAPDDNIGSAIKLFASALTCFNFGWWIYGITMLFDSEVDCGKEMLLMVFVSFWVQLGIYFIGFSCILATLFPWLADVCMICGLC